MVSKLSKRRQRAYVRIQGAQCPYCGSEHLDGGSLELEPGQVCRAVQCRECAAAWYDVYALTGVVERARAADLFGEKA